MGQNAEELKEDIAQTRADLGRDLDALGDRVSPRRMMERRTNRAKRWMGDVRDRVMGTVTAVPHAAAGKMSEGASSAADAVSSGVHAVPDRAAQATRGNPSMAGMVAFGLGFLAGIAITPSSTEEQMVERLEPHLEPLKGELSSSAQEVAESMKESGKEVAEDLQSSAKEHVENVKEAATPSSGTR
jgi:hypothetical protein